MGSWLRAPLALLFLLLAVFAGRLVHTAAEKSFTADEPHYVGTGLYLWKTGDYDWYEVLKLHPPLTFHLASLPLLFVDLPGLAVGPRLGHDVTRAPPPLPQRVRFVSRLPFIALACWGGWLVFAWAREVAGAGAGLLAAFLWTTSPTILAHSALVSSDLAIAVCYLQALYTFWRWWREPSPARFVVCGASIGLALLAKMQAVLLPLALIGIVARLAWSPGATPRIAGAPAMRRLAWAARTLVGLGLLSLGTIALGYGGSLELSAGAPGPLEEWSLPAWIRPLLFDWYFNQVDRRFYVLGELSDRAAWWFLPLGFVAKAPLGLLLLGLGAAVSPRTAKGRAARLGLFLGVPAAVYLAVALFWLRLPMGVRYLLPVFPLLFVAVAVRLAPGLSGWRRGAVAACCAWIAVAGLLVHPHYLAYYNEAFGGPSRGHEIFVESNLDWGQDLGTLARFLRERGNPPVHLAYFGPERPETYGIRAIPLRGCAPVKGLVAISANVLKGLYRHDNWFEPPPAGCYQWLSEREPLAQPGHSIFVYDLSGS